MTHCNRTDPHTMDDCPDYDEPADPCWCAGPWRDVEPADRPDTLEREHPVGSAGCERLPAVAQ